MAWVVLGWFEFDSVTYMDVARGYEDHLKKHHPFAVQRVIACERGLTSKGPRRFRLGADVHDVVAYARRELMI